MSFRNPAKQLLPFGLEYKDIVNADHGTDKPELILPVNGPLSEIETDSARQSITIQQLVGDGPFYTGLILNAMSPNKLKLLNSAPDGIQRYSDKYKKVKKIGRTIEEHPYQLELFPDELYSVMGISNRKKQKLLALSTFKSNGGLREYGTADVSEEDQAKLMLEKLTDMAEELDNGEEKEEEGELEEEDVDDEFDEDDDDDYNAEKYFDDGDEEGEVRDDEAAF